MFHVTSSVSAPGSTPVCCFTLFIPTGTTRFSLQLFTPITCSIEVIFSYISAVKSPSSDSIESAAPWYRNASFSPFSAIEYTDIPTSSPRNIIINIMHKTILFIGLRKTYALAH